MTVIKAIIFDLNKVLVTFDKTDKSDNEYKNKLGISRSEFWKDRDKILDDYTLGKITLDEFLLHQLKKSNLPESQLPIAHELHEKNIELVEGIIPFLETLKKKYKLILMAGEGKESLALKLDNLDISKYFLKIYSTHISKMRKTETDFYSFILKDLNLKQYEVLFIDDQLRYIEAAQRVGIKTIVFENVYQLEKDLASILN